MTQHILQPLSVEALPALPPALESARAALLPPSREARVIVGASGELAAFNAAGETLAPELLALESALSEDFREWLEEEDAGEFGLRIGRGEAAQSYMAQKVSIAHIGAGAYWLLILRQPKLSGSLIQALSQSRALYKDIVQTVPGLVWETRACGTFNFVSGKQLGALVHGDMVGKAPADCLSMPDAMAAETFCAQVPVRSVDVWVSPPGGARLCLSVSARPVFDGQGVWQGARGVALDVTAERLDGEALDDASALLQKSAITDSLTGLLNRRGFEERMSKVCRQLRAADKGGYLALIDLDKFKALNDTQGHHVGDAALIAVGQLLTQHSRKNDLAARLGGDEFALWMDACSRAGAERVCEALQDAMPGLCADLALPGFGLSLSIGVTAFQPGRDDLEGMLKRADGAMYAVKDGGRAHHKFDDDGA
ncbi:MAG: sensor domain-containing diguanylate cyclase [Pseudomonadota bacterium]